MVVLAVPIALSIVLDKNFIPTDKPSMFKMAAVISGSVTALNHYLLRYKRIWTRYKTEFETYSATSNQLATITFFAVYILVFVGLIYLTGVGHDLLIK